MEYDTDQETTDELKAGFTMTCNKCQSTNVEAVYGGDTVSEQRCIRCADCGNTVAIFTDVYFD